MKALAPPFTGFLFVVLALATASLRAETASWPQFRGPLGNGIANADGVPLRFGESENLRWKTPLPGRGWSSPVIADGRAWLTTAEETEATEEEREQHLAKLKAGGMPEGMLAQQHITASIRLAVLEVDLRTGELLREIELARLVHPDSVHQLNSFASPTPVLGEGRLHAHFGTYGTFCLDTDSGEILWEKALFLGIEGDNFRFKMADGNEVSVPKDRFIKADQEAALRLDKIGDDTYTKKSAQRIDTLLATELKEQGFSSFNDLHPLLPGAIRGDRTLGLKKQFPSNKRNAV